MLHAVRNLGQADLTGEGLGDLAGQFLKGVPRMAVRLRRGSAGGCFALRRGNAKACEEAGGIFRCLAPLEFLGKARHRIIRPRFRAGRNLLGGGHDRLADRFRSAAGRFRAGEFLFSLFAGSKFNGVPFFAVDRGSRFRRGCRGGLRRRLRTGFGLRFKRLGAFRLVRLGLIIGQVKRNAGALLRILLRGNCLFGLTGQNAGILCILNLLVRLFM